MIGRSKPPIAFVQRRSERDRQDQPLHEILPRVDSPTMSMKFNFCARRLRVVRASSVPNFEILENRGSVAEPADVLDIRCRLVPEDEFFVLAKTADAIIDLARRHRATAARRPLQDCEPGY